MARPPAAPSPNALHLWVGAVVGLGALAVVAGVVGPGLADRPPVWKLALAALAFLAGDVPALKLRFGHDHHSFTFSEASVVIGLVLLPQGWLLVTAPACVAIAHLVARRAAVKVIFNAAAFAVGVLLASEVHQAAGGATGVSDDIGGWAALGAGALAFFVWNGFSVSAAVSLSQRMPLLSVYRTGLGLNTLVFVGNTAFGVALAALGSARAESLLAVPVFCGLLVLAYRAYLQALEERDTWAVLETVSRELTNTTFAGVAPAVVDRAKSLFRPELVELTVVAEELGRAALVWRTTPSDDIAHYEVDISETGATFWPRLMSERETFEVHHETAATVQRAELEAAGLRQWVVAPLMSHGQCLGALRLGFRGPVRMSKRELQVFSTFVNQVGSAVSNARLFEEMNEERSKLSQVFQHSSDGIFSVDEWGRIRSWNPAMATITGRSAAAAVGRPLEDALAATSEEGAAVNTAWLRHRFPEGTDVQAMVSVPRAGGEPRWVSLSATAVAGADGDAFVAVARDVTAIRAAEVAKQDFVATVSHELRTPLTPLKGFLLTLLRPDFNPSEDERAAFYGRMLDQAFRLERLIEDLLSISRIEQGTFAVENGPVLVDEVIERVAATAPRPLDVTSGGPDAVAHADAGRLEQVLANLVGNATKYSPPDGRITVAVDHRPGEIVIVVADEGPGIADEDQEVIFERFRQLGPHLTRASGGAGLGLYIARRLVDAMGGRIWVESELGQGARFHVALRSELSADNERLILS